MVSDAALQTLDATLNVGMAATLAGLSLVAFAFLTARIQQLEGEAGLIKVKRGGSDAYARAVLREMARLRTAARLVVIATIMLFVSAILMLVAFDTFLQEEQLGAAGRGATILDIVLTGSTFLFGLVSLLFATLALGWEWISR